LVIILKERKNQENRKRWKQIKVIFLQKSESWMKEKIWPYLLVEVSTNLFFSSRVYFVFFLSICFKKFSLSVFLTFKGEKMLKANSRVVSSSTLNFFDCRLPKLRLSPAPSLLELIHFNFLFICKPEVKIAYF
jgi:hypothetical protein